MSYIFDALQRSEAERSGVELNVFDLPTELLQMAETETPTQKPVATPDPIPGPQELERELSALQMEVEVEEKNNSRDGFPQFESLPVALPHDSKLVSAIEKESLAAEKFRFLGVRLRQMQQKRKLKRLLITSTIPEEGKSTVAANLACTLASRRDHKVLLLEGDLRRPTLRQKFGLGKMAGLTEYLQGSLTVEQSIYRLDAVGIWILSAGTPSANPLELLQGNRLALIMDRLDTWFDWIVIDSPPVLPLADTSVWTRTADGILLVTRAGITDRDQLRRGLETVESPKLLGALINSSINAAHSDYYQRYGPLAASLENTRELRSRAGE
jgi:capsular exopolysaccharide synthesis family protein